MCLSVFREDVCQPKHSVTCWSSRKPVESALLVIPLACCLFMFLAHNTMSSPAVNTQNIWHACAVSTSVLSSDGCVVHRLYSLQALVPSLLRHEVEVALEKLGIWDRTYAWDMFLHMMVRHCHHSTV